MAKCGACGTTILFGGRELGGRKFCGDACVARGQVALAASQIPPDMLRRRAQEIHSGPCPKCQGMGPVDVHSSYHVWSALLLTRWWSEPRISCRACGRKRQFSALIGSTLLGWWGFPWGLIMTPVQIGRNVSALLKEIPPREPSTLLEQAAALELGTKLLTLSMNTPPPIIPKTNH